MKYEPIDVFHAIQEATGITRDAIQGPNQRRSLFHARVAFAAIIYEYGYDAQKDIAELVGRDRSTVSYYLNKHEDWRKEPHWVDYMQSIRAHLPNSDDEVLNGAVAKYRHWCTLALEACRGLTEDDLEQMIASKDA